MPNRETYNKSKYLLTSNMFDPASQFQVSDFLPANNPVHVGYLSYNGQWIIKRINNGEIRWAWGMDEYETAWNGRAGLTYGFYNEIFRG